MRARVSTFLVVGILVIGAIHAGTAQIARAEHDGLGHLALLGVAWDHPEITVKINAGGAVDPAAVAAIEGAIADWNEAIDSLGDPLEDFELVLIEQGKADITITLRSGGNPVMGVVGQTVPQMGQGELKGSKIVISGAILNSAFSATLVGNIVRHELGHGFAALGHTDFDDDPFSNGWEGDLMQSFVPSNGDDDEIPISECDLDGFAAAHAWYAAGDPFAPPSVASVDC